MAAGLLHIEPSSVGMVCPDGDHLQSDIIIIRIPRGLVLAAEGAGEPGGAGVEVRLSG